MKVSVIIVSWNVRELLARCLESLEKHASKFPIEVILVDNGSEDDTPEMIRERYPSVKLIVNPDNRGFSAACNQGIAMASGEYYFFLNCDAAVTNGAVETLARTLDDIPKAAIVAPKVQNSDDSVQQSISPFPTPSSELARFFKMRRPSPLFDYDGGLQDVEQPMGAALMIRRSVLKDLGGFDERFFIWFEEVDFCTRVKDKGYRILYQPSAVISHVSGKSFSQHDIVRRQVMFYTSCRQYLEKHFGWRAWFATVPMRVFTGALGVFLPPFRGRRVDVWTAHRHIVARTFTALAAAGAFSYAGYFFDAVRVAGFWAVVLLAFGASMIRLEYGLAIAFAELIVGSKGYLFSFPLSDSISISVRMGIFAAVMFAWLVRRWSNKTFFSFRHSCFFPVSVAIPAFYVYALVVGFMANDRALVFNDANGWLFGLLVLPLYDAIRSRAQILRLLAVAAGAFAAQTAAVFSILYVMSHKGFGYEVQYSFYRWIRTTGLGEITQMSDHFYRIFFQSQIYAVVAFFILLAYLATAMRSRLIGTALKLGRVFWIFFTATIATLVLSLSRSFWIAIGGAGIVFLGHVLAQEERLRVLWSMAWRGIAGGVLAIGMIAVVAFFPLPPGESGIGFDALAQRFENFDSESAARSRWELLPALESAISAHPFAGYGFGKTVTYRSADPRVLETNPEGTYTTYAFEWGYLDLLVKLGLFGLFAILFFLGQLLIVGWRAIAHSLRERALISGLWFGVFALAIVHVFTPYLVHPLGLGILMLAMLCFERLSTKEIFDTRGQTAHR